MTTKKLAIMAMGIVLVCGQCDPLLQIHSDSRNQEVGVEASAAGLADQFPQGVRTATVSMMEESANLIQKEADEQKAEEEAEKVKAEWIALREEQAARREEVKAQAKEAAETKKRMIEAAKKKEEEEKRKIELAKERVLAADATGATYNGVRLMYSEPYEASKGHITRSNGTVRFDGNKETWYSIHEPGQTVTAVRIPGKHIAKDGTIRDKDGYICVAASQRYKRIHTTLMTSLGPAKVYDTGCSYGTIDIYTAW